MSARLVLPILIGFLAGLVFARDDDARASRFGINGCAWSHLDANTPGFDRVKGLQRLMQVVKLGAGWDRCDFWWSKIEPEPGTFVWDDFDWVVEQHDRAGVELLPILCYFPAWKEGVAPVTDEDIGRYANYVYETVKRYRGRVKAYEIWNEPNITPYWTPTPDARDYTRLLKAAFEAAKRADPEVTIVGGAIATVDLAFLKSMLDAGAASFMDVFSFHPYQGDLGSIGPDEGGLAQQIRNVHELLAQAGFHGTVWITEIGHRTPGTAGSTWVSEDEQASHLRRTYEIAQAERVEKVFWFNLQDWDEHWGLIRRDFTAKPAFEAYRALAEADRSARQADTHAAP
jgi:hypothetical protein